MPRRVYPTPRQPLDEGALIDDANAIIARYPAGRSRSALLPMLHLVQSAQGYVTSDGIAFCAKLLHLTRAEVAAVSTFYTMYKRRPTGEYLISVCTNTMCGVLGGQRSYDELSEQLGVGHNQTTADGVITLEHAECLAACDYAPVLTVNYEFFDQVDADKAKEIVAQLRAGKRPHPDRGGPLCGFKQISRQLAGFDDAVVGGHAADNDNLCQVVGREAGDVAGEPTLAGNRCSVATADRDNT
ncbi:MAG: NADH-quinone oxidoreductase subunit NuoE [Acidimicrobiales bacterium]|nr:MAG: NADH-quinone oxidoreductase subunit NuoE [Acidimicrobiales bacterium]